MNGKNGKADREQDWFELFLDRHPDLPSVALIRSMELKHFPREFLRAPILDLCCGDGFFTQALGVEGVFGCDIDPHALKQARRLQTTYRGVWNCDARHLSAFADGQFNTVFSNCALEHVDGIERALGSVARVLKPGGHLIMSVPGANLNNWFFPKVLFSRIGLAHYGQRLCDEYNRKQQHRNIFPFEVWKRKLEAEGLAVRKSFYLFAESEYRLVTFFESLAIDSFFPTIRKTIWAVIKNGTPRTLRMTLWRKLLKGIYLQSRQQDPGAELFIVACKGNVTAILHPELNTDKKKIPGQA